MTKGTEQEWTSLQTAYKIAHVKRETFSAARSLKYGDGSQAYYSAGERKAAGTQSTDYRRVVQA